MIFRSLILLFAIASFLSHARAEFEINTEFANLFTSNGTTQINAGIVGILVADESTKLGIANPYNTVLNVGNYLGGNSDDRIIGIFKSIAGVTGHGAGFQVDLTNLSYSGNFNAGDQLYLLWFPTITTIGSTVNAGQTYGVYTSTSITPNSASGATMSWFSPADGSSNTLSAYLNSIYSGSGVTTADFTANKIAAVPEPSIYGLFGIGAIGIFLLRGRYRARG